MIDDLSIIGRKDLLFLSDLLKCEEYLNTEIQTSRFLIIGGAGSIGQAVTKEIFSRFPSVLHVVDISENNLVELVRDLRSTIGYIKGEFKTFAIDCGSLEFEYLIHSNKYDYIFNLSALKHVRSEKDPYSLMRLIDVNILNTQKTLELAKENGVKKYFCVSTDKAANPVNLMGASKRVMEKLLLSNTSEMLISTARFANVAFSDGSLLHGFGQRLLKKQPISAPCDVLRYFVTPKEAGLLCLFSGILGEQHDIFFPRLSAALNQMTFSDIAKNFLRHQGYEPVLCQTEEEARRYAEDKNLLAQWPVYFFKSDTTGEKEYEEFFTEDETVDWDSYVDMGIVKNKDISGHGNVDEFIAAIQRLKRKKQWTKAEILEIFSVCVGNLEHEETGKSLDERM